MPVTITLSTIPGSIERCDGYSTRTMQLFGPSLGREAVAVATVTDIRTAVQAFGQRVRAVHPDASFMISVSMRKGDRKPRGFDAAYARNGFGEEDFMLAVDKRTKPAPELAEAVSAASAPSAA